MEPAYLMLPLRRHTTAAQTIYLQAESASALNDLIQLILVLLDLATERIGVSLVIGELLLELG